MSLLFTRLSGCFFLLFLGWRTPAQTPPCQAPVTLFAYVSPTTAYPIWTPTNTNQTYTLRWRPAGVSDWTTSSSLTATGYSLSGLRSGTAYEWQVQSACTPDLRSEFTAVQTFTTSACPTPTTLRLNQLLATSAFLFWTVPYQSDTQYELRYRQVGATDWTVVPKFLYVGYSLTGLSNNTSYEWQVRTICSDLDQSSFSDISTFTTICRTPQLTTVQATATTARLSWYMNGDYETNSTYDLQYRKVGAADWTTVSGLTATTYLLSGLTTNETYEYRVRHQCTPAAQSVYTDAASFTTRCNVPTNFSVSNVTSSSAQFVWSGENDAVTTYDIRYRVAGATDWTTITSLTASGQYNYGTYSLTGLPNNTTFEWQIRANCAASSTSDYLSGTNFSTQCRVPLNTTTALITVSSARLDWTPAGAGVQYDVRFRRTGSPDWTQINEIGGSPTLLGIASGASYEWQVRTHCSGNQYSDYSDLITFSTFPCSAPSSFGYSTLTESTVTIGWTYSNGSTDTRMEIRYRPVGAADWTTVSNIVYSGISGSYTITGLTNSTQYEYQLKALCSASASSDFSSAVTFQTKAACAQMYTLYSGNWTQTSTWSCGRIPIATDTVHLKHSITLPANYKATVHNLVYDVPVQLRFSTGSTIQFSK